MNSLQFTAFGIAQPKGSARAFVPKGWKRPIVTSDNPKNKGWQQLVAESASVAISTKRRSFRLIEIQAELEVTFFLPRPKSLKDRMVPHTTKPDLSKLVRSVEDALTGVVWRDDALVVLIIASKGYAASGDIPRAEIMVREIAPC